MGNMYEKYAGAQQATDEGKKRRPDNIAGAQQATPATDRQSLEQALKFFRGRNEGPNTAIVLEAARAHLETLPKPEPARWHVTASKHGPEGTVADPPYITESREAALLFASNYLKQGYTNVGVRQVRS